MDARPIAPDSAHGAEASTMIGGSGLTKSTRREPLEEPSVSANRFGLGGGPLTSVASLFATHLRV
jgi:hypothetical protein